MALELSHTCRGCLKDVKEDVYSLLSDETRGLYAKCTYISLPQIIMDPLPQQICGECYEKCRNWSKFRTQCCYNERRLSSTATIIIDEDQKKFDPVVKMECDEDEDDDWNCMEMKTEPEEVTIDQEEPPDILEMIFKVEDQNNLNIDTGRIPQERTQPVPQDEEVDPKKKTTPTKKVEGKVIKETDNVYEPKKPSRTQPHPPPLPADLWDCPVCDDSLDDSLNFREHLKFHLSEESPDECPICHEKFGRASKVYPHVTAIHMKKFKGVAEELPQKISPNKSQDEDTSLGREEETDELAQDSDSSLDESEEDESDFEEPPDLDMVTLKKEDQKKKKTTPTKVEKKIIKQTDDPKKPPKTQLPLLPADLWDCPVCEESLNDSLNLREHMKCHLSEENPECPICHEKFGRSSKVFPHITAIHMKKFKGAVEEIQKKTPPKKSRVQEHFEESEEESDVESGDESDFTLDVDEEDDSDYEEDDQDSTDYAGKSPDQNKNRTIYDIKMESWKCPICEESFRHRMAFGDHLKTDHKMNENETCPLCPSTITDVSRRLRHIYKFHMDKYRCPVCRKRQSSPRTLNKHLKEVHNRVRGKDASGKYWNCPMCDKSCIDTWDLGKHLKKAHLKKDTSNCPLCPSIFKNTTNVLRHMFHLHMENWKCKLCKKKFYSPRTFADHMATHDKDDEEGDKLVKNWPCPFCPTMEFQDYEGFRNHLDKNHISSDNDCSLCKKQFRKSHEFIAHVVASHMPGKLDCTHCRLGFDEQKTFREHVEEKHIFMEAKIIGVDKQLFRCPFDCTATSEDYAAFRKHLVRVHFRKSTNPNQKCPKCESSFDDEKGVLDHIFSKHLNCQLACNRCDFEQSLPSELNEHILNNHRDRREICVICGSAVKDMKEHKKRHDPDKAKRACECGKKFFSGADLKNHIRMQHTKERKFACPICEKTFYGKADLRRHVQVHTGERPYECHLCPKRFAQAGSLRQHLAVHARNGRIK